MKYNVFLVGYEIQYCFVPGHASSLFYLASRWM